MYSFNIYKIYLWFSYKRNRYPVNPKNIFEKLKKSQYWDRTTTEVYQLNKINELVETAKNNTKYYEGLGATYSSLDEFTQSFPKITKKDVVKYYSSLINDKIAFRIRKSTSGSTGLPMVVEIPPKAMAHRVASLWRFYDWWGVNRYDRYALIKGFKLEKKIKYSLSVRLKTLLRNRLDINVFNLNDETVFDYFNMIERFKPKYMRGYMSGAYLLASLMEKHNLKFKKSNLKVIIVTGEVLFENKRRYIEKILGCKVANEYGSAECGLYGYECPSGFMHIDEESKYITVDEDTNICVTEFFNDGMPLLNYMNEDRVIISNDYCECGRTSRLIDNIQGRLVDHILAPDGSKRHQGIFYYIIEELLDLGFKDSIKQFKVIQDKNNFLFEIVKGENYSLEVSDYIKKRMFEEIGEEIEINIKLVSEIVREKSGKMRFFMRKA